MGINMESDDSRGSSASNSSSESSPNSRPTTPIKEVTDVVQPPINASPGSSSSSSSTSSSSSSRSAGSKTKKKSSSSSSESGSDSSDSSSSSSSSDEDEPKQLPIIDAVVTIAEDAATNVSPSKTKSDAMRSRSNSPEQLYQVAVDLNISHEDLSDVSDIDMDKQAPSKSSVKADDDDNDDDDDDDDDDNDNDDDEEGAISNDSLPAVHESPELNGKRNSGERKSSPEQTLETCAAIKEVKEPERNTNGLDDLVKPHDIDDALDFEAEEGECPELGKDADAMGDDNDDAMENGNELSKKISQTRLAAGSDDEEKVEKGNKEVNVGDNADDVGGDQEDGEDGDSNADADKKKKKDEELEEGEVSDEDEKRPEETEPKPVCRFYTRGQCTWGMSCRFLHPGVTDKGNYTMFESLVRSVPMQSGSGGGVAGSSARASASSAYGNHLGGGAAAAGDYHDYRNERPPLLHRSGASLHHTGMYASASGAGVHHDPRAGLLGPDGPVVVENAWERGLRTAKEMMRKANKRKEQDMDFEDKKMNLTLSPDELEKDPYYLKERGASPGVVRELPPNNSMPHGNPRGLLPPVYSMYGQAPDRYRPYMPPIPYEDVDAYGRMARYRELPPHRMPQYEVDRRLRPAREVIVQRVEAVGRGDEWSDPWMRSKSIGRGASYERDERRRRDRRSYSSNSSYSSSNSSQSDSSSDTSRSSSASDHKRRYSHKLMSASSSRRHASGRAARSPSQIPRRPRRSPKGGGSVSPSYKRSALDKRPAGAHSPAPKRKKVSPTPNKKLDKLRRRHSSSSSESDSSGTSYSDSESGSSSSASTSRSRDSPQKRVRATDKALNERKLIKKPSEQSAKKRSPISIEIKKPSTVVGVSALASPTHSPDSDKEKDKDKDKDNDKDGKKTRREELLKQLRAVEDAIAKKRSKLT